MKFKLLSVLATVLCTAAASAADGWTSMFNGKVTTDWTQPEDWDPAKKLANMPGRKLGEGTIAIQGHDPKSVVHYKDLFIKALP